MREIIGPERKHLLWKDELNDQFILLKYAEVFRFSEKELVVWCWSKKKAAQVRNNCSVLNEDQTGDGLSIFRVKVEDLGRLISLGAHKKRPNIMGRWISDKEKRLGHRIRPYNPHKIKEEVS